MSEKPSQGDQKKKLFMIVGALMGGIFLVWIFVLAPISWERASENDELDTSEIVRDLREASDEAALQYKEYQEANSENTLDSPAPEEKKVESDVPRLPTNIQIEADSESAEEEKEAEN